jgi:site-specific recombinase XerD
MHAKRPNDRSAPRPNATLRYLTPEQVDKLAQTAREHSRHGERDCAMILLSYRHALRVSELCALTWGDINLDEGTIQVSRAKAGAPAVHPLARGDRGVLATLRRSGEGHLFVGERGEPMTPPGVRQIMRRLGVLAGLGRVHPHMLRHATGYKLVNQGTDIRTIQAYLGHRNIISTVRYTEVDARRFKGLL